MSWADLCRQLARRSIRVGRLEGGRWYIEPRSRLGPDLEAGIAEHRDQLVGILSTPVVAQAMKTFGATIVSIKPEVPA